MPEYTGHSIAAFTMVRDDAEFLDVWIRYYGRELGFNALFVIDHGSLEMPELPEEVNVLRLPRAPLDEKQRASLVSSFNAFILESFSVALFSDADELVLPDPRKYDGLVSYLVDFNQPLLAGVGLALLHRRHSEPAISLSSPVLSQRKYVQFHGAYCKPLISRSKTQWGPGFHEAVGDYPIDPDLYIFHLKAMDYRLAHSMLERRRKNPQSDRMLERNQSEQFRLSDDKFDELYFSLADKEFDNAINDFSFIEELSHFLRAGSNSLDSFGSIRRIPYAFGCPF